MNNLGNMGASAIPMLASFMLIGAASSVVFEDSDEFAKNAEQTVNEVMEEITTYLKIDDIIGRYYTNEGMRRVEKIVLLVKPLIQSNIDMSELTIKICNDNDVTLLKYSGHSVECNSSETVFENQVWDKTENAFCLIVIIDKDRSLLDYGVMNKDTAFIAIKLPDRFAMGDDESIIVSLIPSKGITRSIVLETQSFHISDVISFGDV